MVDSAAACAWGGCRGPLGGGSRRRTRLASLASSDDPDPVAILRRIHVRGVVESTIDGRAVGGLAQRAHGLLALVARGALEDEHAVEVVHLVLDDPGLEPAGLDHEVVAVLVAGVDPD